MWSQNVTPSAMETSLPPLDLAYPDIPRVVGDGRYRLLDRLGEGGSGVVFRAETDDGICAVKLRPVPERPIQAARFMVESVPMESIRHPHVVSVLSTGKEGGYLWIAMDLYNNGTLKELVGDNGPPPLEEALRLIEGVLEGLAAVHSAGFIHRDIKPLNIFLNDDGCCAIGDFGVARHLNGGLWFRTRTGQAIGTMGYRAPEQDSEAKDAGPAADIYGVAATLYFLAVGKRPPLLYAAEADPTVLDAVPEILKPVMRRATSYEPADRYPTAMAFHEALRSVRNEVRAAEGLGPVEESVAPSTLQRLVAWWTG